MKQRIDFLELKKRLDELEQGMRPGNKEFDALQERLAQAGKLGGAVSKTTYWNWLTEKEDFPESYFYATPPIGEAQESDRILITGTRVETSDMYDILKGVGAYQRVMRELQARRTKLPASPAKLLAPGDKDRGGANLGLVSRSLAEYGVAPNYTFAARVGSFWENFFDEENFLDNLDTISVPRLIVGTGKMRNYSAWGGETMDVTQRLAEISSEWDIPLQIIESWAP